MSKLPDNHKLIKELDDFFSKLLSEANAPISEGDEDKSPVIGFSEKLRLFSEGGRWVAIKNKIDTGDTEDEFSKLRHRSTGRPRGGGAGSAASKAGSPNGSGEH